MRYEPRIHPPTMILKSVAGNLEYLYNQLDYPNDELVVLNYHSTPKHFLSEFGRQLLWLSKTFNIIHPSQLPEYFAGTLKTAKASLLLTFDDGLKNNLLAAEVLKSHGLFAYFFVVPLFIECLQNEQKAYYLRNIRPIVNSFIDNEMSDFSAMSWEDLRFLKKEGHYIGSHTLSHTLDRYSTNDGKSFKEISESKALIEERLLQKVDAYCSINNTLQSTGKYEKELIEQNYRFHFTTLPGSNRDKDPLFIKRRNVEVYWLKGAVRYALGQWDLRRWQNKIKAFRDL
jgi:peptidoglycan/xylan/chitin deacetylase (PgdA/CDA1 family)